MISKTKLKYYSSLLRKKNRKEDKKFIVDGIKIIEEGINSSYPCELVLFTQDFIDDNSYFFTFLKKKNIPFEIIKEEELIKLSDTENPQGIVAVFQIPSNKPDIYSAQKENLLVYLEKISDPGNLGTIIRTCDWLGIRSIFLSRDCAEIYNPKVIRSTAGSLFHLKLFEDADAAIFFPAAKDNNFKIYCSDIEGTNVYNFEKSQKSIIIFSNEANGPSSNILKYADEKITIPRLGKAESLNVSSAASIILSEFKRNLLRNR